VIKVRFGVFSLAYKVRKSVVDGEAEKTMYRLVYRDEMGNRLQVVGDGADFDAATLGEPLLWEKVIRQRTLEEAEGPR
jgi:hypothetical protein